MGALGEEMATDVRQDAPKRAAIFPSSRLSRRLLPFGLFLALAFALFARTWAHPTTRTIGLDGDPGLYIWFLRWMPHALAHGHNPLFTTHIGYPIGVNLMWNTLLPLPALLLAPATVLLGPVFSYNVMVTLGVALSAWCAFIALRRFVETDAAALLGALVYGFGPYMVTQGLRHANLILAFLPPLFLISLDEILVHQRKSFVRCGIGLGILAATQILLSEEMLASTAVVAAGGLAWLMILHHEQIRSRVAYAWRAIAVAAGTGAALSGIPLAWQFFGPRHIHGTIQATGVYVSDLLGFVLPTRYQMIAPAFARHVTHHFTGNPEEYNAYLGIPLIALMVYVAVRHRRSPLVRWTSLMALSIAIASMGPRLNVAGHITSIHLPWRAAEVIPLVINVLPARLALYTDLMAAILLAVFVEELLRSGISRRPSFAGWLAVGAALVPLVPVLPYPTHHVSRPEFFTSGDVRHIPENSTVLIAPFSRGTNTVDPMVWQALSGMSFRMPEGYIIMASPTGRPQYGPADTWLLRDMAGIFDRGTAEMNSGIRRAVLGELSDLNVQTIVVGPMRHREDMLVYFTELLGRAPESTGGVYVWWDVTARLPA